MANLLKNRVAYANWIPSRDDVFCTASEDETSNTSLPIPINDNLTCAINAVAKLSKNEQVVICTMLKEKLDTDYKIASYIEKVYMDDGYIANFAVTKENHINGLKELDELMGFIPQNDTIDFDE